MAMLINQTTDLAQYGHTAEELTLLIATFGNQRDHSPSDIRDPNMVAEAQALLIEQFKYIHEAV